MRAAMPPFWPPSDYRRCDNVKRDARSIKTRSTKGATKTGRTLNSLRPTYTEEIDPPAQHKNLFSHHHDDHRASSFPFFAHLVRSCDFRPFLHAFAAGLLLLWRSVPEFFRGHRVSHYVMTMLGRERERERERVEETGITVSRYRGRESRTKFAEISLERCD